MTDVEKIQRQWVPLRYENVKDDEIVQKHFFYNKNDQKNFDEDLKKWLANTYNFSNHDSYIFFLWRKCVYSYECLDDSENFNETSSGKEDIYSSLDMEHTTDEDFCHLQRVWEDFGIKNLGKYHNLYIQSSTCFMISWNKLLIDTFLLMC